MIREFAAALRTSPAARRYAQTEHLGSELAGTDVYTGLEVTARADTTNHSTITDIITRSILVVRIVGESVRLLILVFRIVGNSVRLLFLVVSVVRDDVVLLLIVREVLNRRQHPLHRVVNNHHVILNAGVVT